MAGLASCWLLREDCIPGPSTQAREPRRRTLGVQGSNKPSQQHCSPAVASASAQGTLFDPSCSVISMNEQVERLCWAAAPEDPVAGMALLRVAFEEIRLPAAFPFGANITNYAVILQPFSVRCCQCISLLKGA
jgi:hypothetical protein